MQSNLSTTQSVRNRIPRIPPRPQPRPIPLHRNSGHVPDRISVV